MLKVLAQEELEGNSSGATGAVKAAVKRNVQIRWNKGRSWAIGRFCASRGEVLLEGYSVVDARGWRV